MRFESLPKKRCCCIRDISSLALASIRHHTRFCWASEIASVTWIRAAVFTRENSILLIDHNSIRSQKKYNERII